MKGEHSRRRYRVIRYTFTVRFYIAVPWLLKLAADLKFENDQSRGEWRERISIGYKFPGASSGRRIAIARRAREESEGMKKRERGRERMRSAWSAVA